MNGNQVGTLAEIRRYPVKSMQGEKLERAVVGPEGLDGDRRYAVIDSETGQPASAKQTRKWGGLLSLQAEVREGVLVVTGTDGAEVRGDLDAELSRYFGLPVHLEPIAAGGYFDLAPIHLLTTASLRRFRELHPHCDFETRRFRPNLVIETPTTVVGFAEEDWLGQTLRIGELRLRVSEPCPRCVMTTLPQPGLPADPRILRAVAAENAAVAGAYAVPAGVASVAVGDPVWLE